MAVLINWKICDNSKACGGIAECPTGALYWNEAEGTIGINNYFCISCKKCVTDGCPVGAIIVTDSDDAYEKARLVIEKDFRDKAQLFVDRFGAAPISDEVLIEKHDVASKTQSGIIFIERFTDSSIQCLLYSIIVDEVRYKTGLRFDYYKCEDKEIEETEYPVLDIYKDGVLKGSVCGYYSDFKFEEFVGKIKELVG